MNHQLPERSVTPGGNRSDQAASVSSSNRGGEGGLTQDLGIPRDWVFEQSGDDRSGQAASSAETEAVSAYLGEREMEIPQRI